MSGHAPYRQERCPRRSKKNTATSAVLIRKYAPKDKVIPIISGEWGYSSAWPGMGQDEAARVERQGKYLHAAEFLTNIANDVALLHLGMTGTKTAPTPRKASTTSASSGTRYHPGRESGLRSEARLHRDEDAGRATPERYGFRLSNWDLVLIADDCCAEHGDLASSSAM